MPEWNLSSLPVDSLIYQNQTQALTISRRSWKQGSDGLVLIKSWLWELLEPPAAIPVNSIVVILKCFYFFTPSEAWQAGCVQWQKNDKRWSVRKFCQIPSYIHVNGSIYCLFLRTWQLVVVTLFPKVTSVSEIVNWYPIVCQSSREKQNQFFFFLRFFSKELDHMIMEAEKSPDLQPARLRGADSKVPV